MERLLLGALLFLLATSATATPESDCLSDNATEAAMRDIFETAKCADCKITDITDLTPFVTVTGDTVLKISGSGFLTDENRFMRFSVEAACRPGDERYEIQGMTLAEDSLSRDD